MLRYQLLVFAVVLSLLASRPFAHAAGTPPETSLMKTVILMRHGVRAPTQSAETLREWSARPWPAWPAGRGELTLRGAELVSQLWRAEGHRLRTLGLLPAGHLSGDDVLILADLDQRTRTTAQAVLHGLEPDADLYVHVHDVAAPDPLFHPVKAHYCAFNAEAAAADIPPSRIDGLTVELASSLHELGNILGSAAPAWCIKQHRDIPCRVTDTPSRLAVTDGGYAIGLEGGLPAASSAAEIFLLEYGEWSRNAAWGELDATGLTRLLRVHTETFNLINRAPSVAAARGSALLADMVQALTGTHPDPAFNTARLVIYVGHDTNLANLGSLLNLHWHMPGYPPDDIPPASMLALQLWNTPQGPRVSAQYLAQTLETFHNPAHQTPPLRQDLLWSADGQTSRQLDPDVLRAYAARLLRRDCIPVRSALRPLSVNKRMMSEKDSLPVQTDGTTPSGAASAAGQRLATAQ